MCTSSHPSCSLKKAWLPPQPGPQSTLQAVFPEKLTLSWSSACGRFKENPGDQHPRREGQKQWGAGREVEPGSRPHDSLSQPRETSATMSRPEWEWDPRPVGPKCPDLGGGAGREHDLGQVASRAEGLRATGQSVITGGFWAEPCRVHQVGAGHLAGSTLGPVRPWEVWGIARVAGPRKQSSQI